MRSTTCSDLQEPAGLLKNHRSLEEYYRMSSQRLFVDTTSLRAAADGSAGNAAALDDYRHACEQWIADCEGEIMRCHGVVAAPVGAALQGFYTGLADQAATVSGDHCTMGENLATAAERYDNADAAGAALVQATGGVL
jgi:hypothetical protein